MTTSSHASMAAALSALSAQQTADAEAAYVSMIRDPNSVDRKHWLKIAQAAGKDHAQVQADLHAMTAISDARLALVDLTPIEQELMRIGEALKAHNAETDRIVMERQKASDELMNRVRLAHLRANAAHQAMRRLSDLETAHGHLLGLPAQGSFEYQLQAQAEDNAKALADLNASKRATRIEDLEYRIHTLKTTPWQQSTAEQQRHALAEMEQELAGLKPRPAVAPVATPDPVPLTPDGQPKSFDFPPALKAA